MPVSRHRTRIKLHKFFYTIKIHAISCIYQETKRILTKTFEQECSIRV